MFAAIAGALAGALMDLRASPFARLVALAVGVVLFLAVGVLYREAYIARRQCRIEARAARMAEEMLQDSEERFHSIVSQAAVGICLASPDGSLRTANQKLCDMLGYSREELLRRNLQENVYPDDLASQQAQLAILLAGEIRSFAMQLRYIRSDGSLLWADLTCSAIRQPKPLLVNVIHDVTARKVAEDGLRESETKFRTLADNARAVVGIVQGTKFAYANRYLSEISGYSLQELVGMEFLHLVDPAFRSMIGENARKRQAGEEVPASYDFVMRTRTGEAIWIELSTAFMIYNGKPAIIGTGFNITERVRAETALRDSESRLEQAKLAAEKDNSAKDHFLAMLSHELRTPLSPMLGAASLLSDDQRLPDDVRQDMQMVRRNAQLEARLVDDLLDLTRIVRGKLELRTQPVELSTLLRQAIETCSSEISAKALHFTLDSDCGERWTYADPARLQQVFWNLLSNAIKFTRNGGKIAVYCRDEHREAAPAASHSSPGENGERWFVVEVRDDGEGMAPEVLPRIFAPFEQGGRSTTRRFGGLGLGLAITKALVELHGGTITASSPGQGQGSTFTVRLPAGVTIPSVGAAEPLRPAHAQAPARLSILLVEDHADTAYMLRRLLQADGHRVDIAASMTQGLAKAHANRYELLISDLGLPDGSGLDLMRTLRAEGRTLPAIALSGYGQEQDITDARDAGFVTHITKPVDIPRLRETIRSVVNGA